DRISRFAERLGWLKLDTTDSETSYLADGPYLRDGDEFVTNPIVRDTLIVSHFRARKGNAWRMFVLGESFAMGTPYVDQNKPDRREGGISSWLAADLQALWPGGTVEIINAAAGGQSSNRVRMIADEVVRLEPDAVLVAACNNEGILPPSRVDEWLHRDG